MSETQRKSQSAGLFERLPGETDFFVVTHDAEKSLNSGIVLLAPIEDDNEPLSCSLFITNYRLVVQPYRAGRTIAPIDLPLMMLQSWKPGKHSGNGPADIDKRKSDRAVIEYQTVDFQTKHMWLFRVGFEENRQFVTARKALDAMRPTHLKMLPAFDIGKEWHKQWVDQGNDELVKDIGWNFFDLEEEMTRQLTLDSADPRPSIEDHDKCGPGKDLRLWFRSTSINQPEDSFGMSPTYPFKVIVPSAASEKLLLQVLDCRSRARIPAISFVHLGSGGVLARASQPLRRKDCTPDGRLCQHLIGTYTTAALRPRDEDLFPGSPMRTAAAQQEFSPRRTSAPPPSLLDDAPKPASAPPPSLMDNPSPMRPASVQQSPQRAISTMAQRYLNVVDCRPQAAAMGNDALGGGYEKGETYECCRTKFYNIDNIHGVTASFTKMRQLLQAFNGQLPKGEFYARVHDSLWLTHVQRVLVCSREVAEMLDRGESALVHCTDGWDRTSQTTSLAMMMLDPYYRTIRGFCLLIEKEWCSFGHKFAERNSHEIPGDTYCQVDTGLQATDVDSSQDMKAHKQQPSPIFTQWLDCVYQFIRQFPTQFEFTPELLMFLGRHVYSCYFGTFLTNTAKERVFEGVKMQALSLWTYIDLLVEEERAGSRPIRFVNPNYDAATAIKYIKKEAGSGIRPLFPNTSSKRLVFWEEHYLQFDSDTWATELGRDHRLGLAFAEGEKTAPVPIGNAEMEEFMNSWRERAVARRVRSVATMKDVLSRLKVPPRPQAPKEDEKRQRDEKAKQCWSCQAKFGWFTDKSYCSECNVALCAKCVCEVDGQKVCLSCANMMMVAD